MLICLVYLLVFLLSKLQHFFPPKFYSEVKWSLNSSFNTFESKPRLVFLNYLAIASRDCDHERIMLIIYYSKKLFLFCAINNQYSSWRKRNISLELEIFCVGEKRSTNGERRKGQKRQIFKK